MTKRKGGALSKKENTGSTGKSTKRGSIALIKKELSIIPRGWITMLEAEADVLSLLHIEAVKVLTRGGTKLIIFSSSRPYSNLISMYTADGVNLDNTFIVDGVSGSSENTGDIHPHNVLCLGTVSSLTNIAVALDKIMGSLKGDNVILVDSVTTLLIYNKPDVLARFLHMLLTKMRIRNIGGLLLSVKSETDNEVRAQIAQLCDKVIKV